MTNGTEDGCVIERSFPRLINIIKQTKKIDSLLIGTKMYHKMLAFTRSITSNNVLHY